MNTKIGIDSAGIWTPAQYAIDAGWTRECVEATARLGVADKDAEGLTDNQRTRLLEWCIGRAKTRKPSTDKAREWVRTDPTGCARDVARLGLAKAVKYNLALVRDRAATGDQRWAGITVSDMRVALEEGATP